MEKTVINNLIAFRKELHQHPEVSQQEYQTQEKIVQFLRHIGVQGRKIGKTGVIAVVDSNEPGKTVMLRSDHDALPIQEINEFDYKSKCPGVSHKCGHDGHTAIMCGVADYFVKNPPQKGKVVLVFQPSEENGEGAKAIFNDPEFDVQPDIAIAMHNLPGYELNKVVYRHGSFTAAVKSIIIKLDGKTSHAAEPEKGINPAMAISALIKFFQEVNQPKLDHDDFALTTPVHIKMGNLSYGVSAGHAEVHYTLRTWDNATMGKLVDRIIDQVDKIGRLHNIAHTVSWTEEFDANQNDPEAVRIIKSAIDVNQLKSEERPTPFKWGEDFGLFTKRFKGAMFGIGAGTACPALHNPDYDFPDEIIPTGMKMFTTITEKVLNE